MRGSIALLALAMLIAGCGNEGIARQRTLTELEYRNKVLGAWQATMVANESGLDLQGIWLERAGPGTDIELLFPDQWSTDDDTHIEWLDLHILEEHGIDPSYEQIRDEWVDHLNNDIWVATRRARTLMDQGLLPPDTGSAALNPEGVWAIDAQLENELFGLIAPGLPKEARRRARFFAKVTNSGLAVDVAAFYAHMYSEAFMQPNIDWLLDRATKAEPVDSKVRDIVTTVRAWHGEHPEDWRATRELIRSAYDKDPEWWGSQVNFAVTIMALLYGESDLIQTLNIAGLAGWDADNNMTTSAGLLGVILGFEALPDSIKMSSDVYFNEDLIDGGLPMFDSVSNIAKRTADLGIAVVVDSGGVLDTSTLEIPL